MSTTAVRVRRFGPLSDVFELESGHEITQEEFTVIRRGSKLIVEGDNRQIASFVGPAWAEIIRRMMLPEDIEKLSVKRGGKILVFYRWVEVGTGGEDELRNFYHNHLRYVMGDPIYQSTLASSRARFPQSRMPAIGMTLAGHKLRIRYTSIRTPRSYGDIPEPAWVH